MLYELVAVVIAGVGMAGIAFGIRKITRNRAPQWIVPVMAGLGMLGLSVYNEYSWFEVTSGGLPEGAEVIDTAEVKAFYKPWTYAWPQVEGFLAIADVTDTAATGERAAVLYRMMRWQPEQVIAVRFKCETSEIARVLTDGGAEPFAPLDPQDPMMQAVCSRS
ncbi:hypothetical protein [Marivivens donghaensis]|uniref:hypothetical protein n=1 Tax=Marivivens donghaensis TaxID=1699413 RepID=UPI003F698764